MTTLTGNETAAPAADRLHQTHPGIVHLPGTEEYAAHTVAWNLAITQRPAAVAVPSTAAEVVAVVRSARELGLRVAPQTTGHAASALARTSLDDVVLLHTTAMRGVQVDVASRTARVEGGAQWQDLVPEAARHGLAAMHGSAGDVGIVGYCLGGGLSWYARKHGLAAHQVTAVELVTATGDLIRADASQNTDLLWALRGGNAANFGVVVACEFNLLPITDVHAGMMLWDISHAETVLKVWASWAVSASDDVTTSLRVMRFPPLPELPPFLSGRSLVVIDGAHLGSDDEAAAEIAVLRQLQPEMDTFGRVPADTLIGLHMDPPAPTPGLAVGGLVSGLDQDGLRAFLDEVGPEATTGLMFAELRQVGGAVARPDESGALSHLPASFVLFGLAVVPFPEAAAPGQASLDALVAGMKPWLLPGRAFANFNEGEASARANLGPAYDRVRQIRAQYDPEATLAASHEVV